MNVFDYFFEKSGQLDKNFILGNKEVISFSSLYSDSLILASFLHENHGCCNNIVLTDKNSVFFIIAYLAIIKSGNTCVPIDAEANSSFMSKIIAKTGSNIVFSNKPVESKRSSVYNYTDVKEILLGRKVLEFGNEFDSESVAEIIFTSGSTGEPKGVMITHKNLISNTNSIIQYLKLTNNDVVCNVLPFHYCYGLSVLHTHLRVGGSMVINNTFIFIGTVINDLTKYKCTGFSGVPSHFQIILRKTKSFLKQQSNNLRYVTQAGGKLHDVYINDFVNNYPDIDFYVMYGQTEATARLSYLEPNKVLSKLGSIGKGIPGVQLRIVDGNDQDIGPNVTGEIIANGDNIMKGYYNDKNATSEKIKNGWLYTGDLGRMDDDGYFYIVGRKNNMIKVGGNKVSPKEVEEVIITIPGVIDCLVEAVEDDILGEAIKVYVIPDTMIDINKLEEIILKKCKKELEAYKIPKTIEFKEKFNLKSSGKIQK